MRFLCISALLFGSAFAQPAPPPAKGFVPDDAVVATSGDKKYTAGELRAILERLPQQPKQFIAVNPASGLGQLFALEFLAGEAKKDKIDQQSPYKEEMEMQRTQFLAQAYMNTYMARIVVPAEEQEKYYKQHSDEFQQAKVRVIYVAFSAAQVKPDSKALTQEEAKTKIENLRKKLTSGADFAALAKENSDDKESAANGGEWGIVKRTSNQPAEVKNAIFSLKAGAISEPLKQANGYYLFKVDGYSTQSFDEVSQKIGDKLKQERYDQWLKGIQKRFDVKVENQEFFAHQPGAPGNR